MSTPSLREPLLTVNEASAWMRISRSGMYRLVREGHVQPVFVGSRLRFDPDELRRYIREGAPSGWMTRSEA